MYIIPFFSTKELYDFLRESDSLGKLKLFRDTKMRSIPKGNYGYVLVVDGQVAGAASMYDECDGGWLNELFEIVPEFRGKGLSRPFYSMVKEHLDADFIHGFATDENTKSLWEHLGQVCIDKECMEMIDICDGRTIEEYLKDERPELLDEWRKANQ